MTRHVRLALSAAAAGAFVMGQMALAQDSGAAGLSDGDRKFVMKAAQGGMAEVKLGQLAEERASSTEVKKFAAQVVEDHSKANGKLKEIAQSKNITLNDSLDPKAQALHDKLSALNGMEFDHAYMNAMRKDHQKDVSKFRKQAKKGQDPDIKSFAEATLPTLESHLRMAEATGMPRREANASADHTGIGAGTDQMNTDNMDGRPSPMPPNQNAPGSDRNRPNSNPR